jgi:hypothetical protein
LFSSNRDASWVKGTRDWGHLTYLLDIHEKSAEHIKCCVILDQWRLNKTLSAEMEDDMRKEASFWKQVIERVINVTLMLAASSLAFRGHDEYDDDNKNSGNFVSYQVTCKV